MQKKTLMLLLCSWSNIKYWWRNNKSIDEVVFETTNMIVLVFAIVDLISQVVNEHKAHVINPFKRVVLILDRPMHSNIIPFYSSFHHVTTTIRYLPTYILLWTTRIVSDTLVQLLLWFCRPCSRSSVYFILRV